MHCEQALKCTRRAHCLQKSLNNRLFFFFLFLPIAQQTFGFTQKQVARKELKGRWFIREGTPGNTSCCCCSFTPLGSILCCCSMPGFPAFTVTQSLFRSVSIESVMPSNTRRRGRVDTGKGRKSIRGASWSWFLLRQGSGPRSFRGTLGSSVKTPLRSVPCEGEELGLFISDSFSHWWRAASGGESG